MIWTYLSFFNNQLKVTLKLDNLFKAGGFQMDETYSIGDITYRKQMKHTGRPRTLTMNFTYSFGKIEEDKWKGRSRDNAGGGGMDMGF